MLPAGARVVPHRRSRCYGSWSLSIMRTAPGNGYLLLVFAWAASAQQSFELFLEFAHILEVPIDGGEADVGYRVEAFEMRHDQLADFAGGAFALGGVHQKTLGCVD